jgi:hypothetical protein
MAMGAGVLDAVGVLDTLLARGVPVVLVRESGVLEVGDGGVLTGVGESIVVVDVRRFCCGLKVWRWGIFVGRSLIGLRGRKWW